MQIARLGAAAAFAAVLVSAGLVGCGGGEDPNPPVKPKPAFGEQPNIVFVLTDDQDYGSYDRRFMPNTVRLIGGNGTTFTNYWDTTPLCCPARAGLLTGQYGHSNGVLNNKPGYGNLAEPDNVLPVWLQRAGYQTANVGKFLNGYESAVDDKDEVAPGWDHWSVEVGNGRGYYDFKLAVDGKQRKEQYHGQYLTDVLNRRAVEYLREMAATPQPFYLQLWQSAPHVENINANSGGPCGGEAVPPKRDLGRFGEAKLPRMPGVLEQDVSDKPPIVSGQPPIGPKRREVLRHRYQCRVETLPAVDRGVRDIVSALRQAGELDETIIVFSSDNGTFDGQHRLPGGKGLAYEEAAHLPLVVRVPAKFRGGEPAPATSDALVANIDYAPTVVDWAGTETCPEAGDCRVMDGRSLIGLLGGRHAGWPSNRAIGTELDLQKDEVQPGRGISCSFEGARQGRWLYVRHTALPDLATGACEPSDAVELYDHARDPFELENLAPTLPGSRAAATEERLAALSERLAACAGIEGRDPEPASGHYCD
jgi:N-acetylglucosamine-6-sulfatase